MQREYRHAYLSFHGKDTVQVEVNRERLRLFVPLLVVTVLSWPSMSILSTDIFISTLCMIVTY